MLTTEVLIKEHRTIREMLALLNTICDHLDAGIPVVSSDLRDTVDFIREFADRFHHGKEEDLLFPAMEAAGIPRDGGPIGVMLMEHKEGRKYAQAMAAAIKFDDSTFVKNARNYTRLLDQHIYKEDNILYPLADRVLSADQQQELEQAYENVDQSLDGPARWSKARELIQRLSDKYGSK
ncbi:MAG: hemerythrin [FCB group bacterium]|nr:hemerythrin [FCB group bacterium]